MNNKMITIPYADAIEYGENTSALFKACLLYTSLGKEDSVNEKHLSPDCAALASAAVPIIIPMKGGKRRNAG